ncbi:hypothetical protein RB595_008648 [Gaeumannomyces hyphopodioides]
MPVVLLYLFCSPCIPVYPSHLPILVCTNNMSASLGQLPPELLLQIRDLLGLRDRLHLSATRYDLRAAAVHEWGVFRSIRFSARSARSADSVLAVVKRYPGLVRKLKLVISPAPYTHSDLNPLPTYEDPGLLPESALALLRGYSESDDGQQLAPGLERLAVEFPDAHAFRRHLGRSEVSMYLTSDGDDAPEFARDNNTMVDHVLEALTHTTHPVGGATRLAVLNLPPHRSPVFATHQWRRFLGRVRSLELSVFGERHTFDLTSNGDAAYRAAVGRLADHVFRHLAAAETLRFYGSAHAPLGYEGGAPLPLVAAGMPRLRRLTLGNVCAGDQLLEFLEAHEEQCGRLRSVHLVHATAGSRGPRWSDFFRRLIDMRIQISSFGVKFRDASIADFTEEAGSERYGDEGGDGGSLAARAMMTERLLEAQSRLSAWPYAGVHGEFGGWVEDTYRNVQSLMDGLDEPAYEEFMGMVDATADGAASKNEGGPKDEEYSESEDERSWSVTIE